MEQEQPIKQLKHTAKEIDDGIDMLAPENQEFINRVKNALVKSLVFSVNENGELTYEFT